MPENKEEIPEGISFFLYAENLLKILTKVAARFCSGNLLKILTKCLR
jgi:hypothetical protein